MSVEITIKIYNNEPLALGCYFPGSTKADTKFTLSGNWMLL